MSSTSEDTVEDRLLQVSEQLRIPTNTRQITQVRLGQLQNKPDVDEGNLDNFVAAALALSAREDGLPIGTEAIATTWNETLDDDREIAISEQLLETASVALDIDEIPPHPEGLVERLGQAVEMPTELTTVARRLLRDAYETDPAVIANGRSPAATAGGALALAALANGHDADDVQGALGGASKTSRVAVQNRCEDLRDLLGDERLQDDRYSVAAVDTATAGGQQATAADGAGPAETDSETPVETAGEGTADAPASGAEADGDSDAAPAEPDAADDGDADAEPSPDDVEAEIDALVDELDVDASSRLMALGMVGDAVGEVAVGSAAELAGATLVASLRLNDADSDVVDVAGLRSFEPRDITQSLDGLDAAVDIDIPRRSAGDVVDELVAALDLPESVHDESRRSLERYDGDGGYTAAELGAGAVVFAATVNGTQVDLEELSAISGAGASYVTDAMNDIVVSLCLALVRGEIDYEECSWTTDLLESDLSPDLGDSQTGRAIAIAKTYVAGRESRHVDDATLDAVLGGE